MDIVSWIKKYFSKTRPDDLSWCVVANIVQKRPYGPNGKEHRIGTKYFRPGTKVYIIDWYPGICENIVVIGLARKPRRFIKITIRADWVESLRVKPIYSRSVLQRALEHHNEASSCLSKTNAEQLLKAIPVWQKESSPNTENLISRSRQSLF